MHPIRAHIERKEGKEANVAPKNETNLLSRLNLDFTAVTQSDAGIEFGGFARYRYNQSDAAITSRDVSGGRLHAVMGPVTLQVGNIADAIDALPGRSAGTAAIPTLNGSVAINPIVGFASQAGGAVNGANLQYSMAGLKVFLSATDSDNEEVAGHVAYTMSGWTVAAGALDAEDGHDITALSVMGDLGFATVGGAFARNANAGPADDDADKVRFHANIPFGTTSLIVWGADEEPNGTNDGGSFGLEVAHDLGGGVKAIGGYSSSAAVNDLGDVVSAEIQFAF